MALKIQNRDVWAGDLADSPGSLAQLLGELAGGGANLEFVIARRDPANPGRGQVFVTPIQGARAESAAGSSGLSRADDVATLRIDGVDRAGLGSKMMRAIADQGINVRGVSAAAIGGKFICYIGFDSREDAARALAALGEVNAGRSGAARRSGSKGKRAAAGGKKKSSLRTKKRARR